MKGSQPKLRFNLIYILIAAWMVVIVHDFMQLRQNVETVPYSQFLSYLDAKNIDEVAVGSKKIEGTLKSPPKGHPKYFAALKMDDPQLMQRLTNAGAKFGAIIENTFFRDILSWLLPIGVMMGLWWLLLSRFGRAQSQFMSLGKSKAKVFVENDLKTRFSDVAGVDEAKFELKEVVDFLRNPADYSRLGGRMPKGILLVGPPGTGKTMLARAVAGEAGVAFFSINGSEFVEMFVGLGAARVRDLFEQARAHAPCIIFIDELDALGRARGLNALNGAANNEKEQTLNQLLAEMDGFDSSTGVMIIAATNRPEVLDPALLRAGRFDRQILVDRPDRKGREAILAVHVKKVQLTPSASIETVASMTAGFSGADLANLVNEAALIATRRKASGVEARDFTEAIERVVAGLERKNRILNADEKRRVAYHEMGHATVALAMGRGEAVHKVTVIPRGLAALGYTFKRPTEDRYLMAREDLEIQIAMLLGGRASEKIFLSNISTGAADDLDKATEIARAMVTRYGMSEQLGLATYERPTTPMLGGDRLMNSMSYSEQTARVIDQEVKSLMDRSMVMADGCLKRYHDFIDRAVQKLLVQETLDETELKSLWAQYRNLTVVEQAV